MVLTNNKKNILNDKIIKYTLITFTWLVLFAFLGFIIFILVKSIPGIQHYGFNNIIFNNKFNINDPNSKDASVWIPLSITLLTAFGALLISIPLSIKTASFIFFRIKNKKLFKTIKIIIEVTAGIPSVIFGFFASSAFGTVIETIFGLNTVYTILTAIFMLSFMMAPTIISLTLNTYQNIDKNLLPNSISLGLTKTKSFYKVFRRESRGALLVIAIIALGRILGETTAIKIILDSESYSSVMNNGLISVLNSKLAPLGSVISIGMFSENGGESLKSLMFFYGIVLFLVILLLNGFIHFLTSLKSNNKYKFINNFNKKILHGINSFIYSINILFNKIFKKNNSNDYKDVGVYISNKLNGSKKHYIYSWYKMFWEIISISIIISFIVWIMFDILIQGFQATATPYSTLFVYTKNTTGQATINTLLIIFISILISFPISLITAIYINEIMKSKKNKARVLFFLDSLSSAPSIIYGMFGMVFFLEVLGFSISGAQGKSLLAGILTISLVIIPGFTRNIQQALSNIPNIIRENGIALGIPKSAVIFKLILGTATKSIISTIILSIGRILSETSALYLTAGLSSASQTALLNPGQTLTTRMYAQLYSSNNLEAHNIIYESALSTLLLIFTLTLIGHLIIPFYKEIYYDILLRIQIYKNQRKKNINFKKISYYKNQIVNNELYLSEDQWKALNLNSEEDKYILKNFKKIKIKYLSSEEYNKLIKG